VVASAARIQDLRGRDLSKQQFFGIVLDGVFLAKEIAVVVAVGLCADGRKMVLDFEVGSSESYEVSRELVTRIIERGFRVDGKLFAVLDGSAALEKAILERWPDAIVQGCLIHKERNLHAYLSRKDHAECSRLMKNIRLAEGAEAGKQGLKELKLWVGKRSQQALQSLERSGDRLIALHLLNVPSTLNQSLLSTNLIENVILNYRRQTARVNRWRLKGDQVARWSASALLWAEQGFYKIRGHIALPKLLAALAHPLSTSFQPVQQETKHHHTLTGVSAKGEFPSQAPYSHSQVQPVDASPKALHPPSGSAARNVLVETLCQCSQ
jgi:putative transposase